MSRRIVARMVSESVGHAVMTACRSACTSGAHASCVRPWGGCGMTAELLSSIWDPRWGLSANCGIGAVYVGGTTWRGVRLSGCRQGTLAHVVGSLRRDRARPGLPVWELSVALGRRRSDVPPAVVRHQARAIGLLWRVGWHACGW